jgi:serine/threonine protein kinase
MSYSQAPSFSTDTGERRNFRPVPTDYNAWQHMTRTIEHYERLDQVGEGTYGQVYRARCRDSGRIVALKKMRIQHGGYWGMPLQFIREIKILKRLQHPNLLRMIEVVTSKSVEHLDNDDPRGKNFQSKDKATDVRESYKGNLFLVLEYVDHDLAGLLDVAYQFTPVQIKCIFKQLLEALAFMHQNKYVRCYSFLRYISFLREVIPYMAHNFFAC